MIICLSPSSQNPDSNMITIATAILLPFFCSVKSDKISCPPCTCRHDNIYGGTEVVCSALNLYSFPSFTFPNVTSFLFDENNIKKLETSEFQHLANLHHLDLSLNNIFDIDRDAFKGLSNLLVLRLDGNELRSLEKKKHDVFAHLNQLKVLYLNSTEVSVSGRHIGKLTFLQVLYVDCFECIFNQNFLNLRSFSNLTFPICLKRHLTNFTFVSVPNLQSLTLNYCGIVTIESGTFAPMKRLLFLDLSYNQNLGFTELTKGSYGLRNSQIQYLFINYISDIEKIAPLDKYSFQYLENTSLKELHCDGNAVEYVAKGTFGSMPETIQVISAKYTVLGSFTQKNFSDIISGTSLTSIDLTNASIWDPGSGWSRQLHYSVFPTVLPLPPGLQVVKLSNQYYRAEFGSHICHPNVFKRVVLRGNLITSFTGPVTGADSVTYVDLSSNKLHKVGSNSLPHNNCLRFLNLSNNNLGKCFEKDENGSISERASLIETLDISNNRISSLPRMFFKGLQRIKYLDISNNVLLTFRVKLGHMFHLQYLDLSNNRLQLLPVDVLKDLDVVKNTVINLQDNSLACFCQSLQFLQWVRTRQERIQELDTMTCRLQNGTQVGLNNLDTTVSQLEKQCSSNVVLITVTVSSIICVLVVIGLIAGYRNRWKLRYLYHAGRRGYQVLNDDDDVNYRYDAFVSYADEDRGFVISTLLPELEQKSGLKLCIHHRDFLPGAVITENIVASIQNSRKTLLILSPSFLKSEWCSYEFNMALVEGISRKQNTIVMVLYKHVKMKNVPKDLAVMLSNNSYLEYNIDLHGGVVFWNNLVESIGTIQPLH